MPNNDDDDYDNDTTSTIAELFLTSSFRGLMRTQKLRFSLLRIPRSQRHPPPASPYPHPPPLCPHLHSPPQLVLASFIFSAWGRFRIKLAECQDYCCLFVCLLLLCFWRGGVGGGERGLLFVCCQYFLPSLLE